VKTRKTHVRTLGASSTQTRQRTFDVKALQRKSKKATAARISKSVSQGALTQGKVEQQGSKINSERQLLIVLELLLNERHKFTDGRQTSCRMGG